MVYLEWASVGCERKVGSMVMINDYFACKYTSITLLSHNIVCLHCVYSMGSDIPLAYGRVQSSMPVTHDRSTQQACAERGW